MDIIQTFKLTTLHFCVIQDKFCLNGNNSLGKIKSHPRMLDRRTTSGPQVTTPFLTQKEILVEKLLVEEKKNFG